MMNFEEIKTKIGEIVGLSAEKVSIGFLTRVYEVTFTDDLTDKEGNVVELTKAQVDAIVSILADGVVRTIDYVGFGKKDIVIAFHMNHANGGY